MFKKLHLTKPQLSESNIAIFELVYKFFVKSKIGIISFFAFPLLFMLMYFFIGNEKGASFFSSGLPSFLSLGILSISLVILPQMLVEIKSSILLRKIAVSNISKLRYIMLIFFGYIAILLLETLYVFILYFMFLNTNASESVKGIKWGGLFYGLITLFFSSIAFGVLLGVVFNNSLSVQICGFGIFFASLLFSGQFVPIQVIGSVAAVQYISLFSPLSYSLGLLNTSLFQIETNGISPEQLDSFIQGTNIFNIEAKFFIFSFPTATDPIPKELIIYDSWHKVLNLIMPFVICGGMNWLSWSKFKWSNR
ncbi:MAG: ABC transporter permease [Mycoplasma sp.]